ncbi:MAG: hypothetical protein HYY01_03470 [Chloroflexi bacterium]|nr:hypothetical protein [Chloroflexota bacterium]
MKYRWVSTLGRFEHADDLITFRGATVAIAGSAGPAIGNYISDQRFSGGSISAQITFTEVSPQSACEFILYYDPSTRGFVTAGLGGGGTMFSIRYFSGSWVNHFITGDRANLQPGKAYEVRVLLQGSRVTLTVDGVDVAASLLPFHLPSGQVGLWCLDTHDIRIQDFTVAAVPSKAFVIMQFTSPYNELYQDVVKPVCSAFQLEPMRADEAVGPGIILADIVKQINDSRVIIADVSPANPNVYYELGYAHALNKPTILIAEHETKLPFDVSPFRVLLYENTIRGKMQIDEGLRRHLQAVLSAWGGV